MKESVLRAYAREADREEGYYHSVASKYAEFEPNVSGRARRNWRGPRIVYGVELTWNQYQVWRYWKQHPNQWGQIRKIADSIGVAPSTVSRAFVRLTILHLAWVDSRRGRYGGTRFIIPPKDEWRQRARKALAKLKLSKERLRQRWDRRYEYWLGYWRDRGMNKEYIQAARVLFGMQV